VNGIPVETPPVNAPGMPALSYRLGTYSSFLARMLDRIHSQEIADGPNAGTRPLAALTTRAANDPAIAFIDAAATLADVLTFYQERIANEGFLRTATERRSVLQLARAIGYELAPGVAASAYLSFTVQDHVPNAGSVTIPAGTKVQSVPPQGALPQMFETSSDISAQAAWNVLPPRQTHPQDLALYQVNGSWELVSLGLATSYETSDAFTIDQSNFGSIHPLFDTTTIDPALSSITARPADQIFLNGIALNIHNGDRMLFVGVSSSGDIQAVVEFVYGVTENSAAGTTAVNLARQPVLPKFRPIYRWVGPTDFIASALAGETTFDDETAFAGNSAVASSGTFAFTTSSATRSNSVSLVKNLLGDRAVSESFYQGTIRRYQASGHWVAIASHYHLPPKVTVTQGIFAMQTRVAFFGANAQQVTMLSSAQQTALGNANSSWGSNTPDIWHDSSAKLLGDPTGAITNAGATPPAIAYLERSVPEAVAGGWAVIEDETTGAMSVYAITVARDLSVADFAMSGRVTSLELKQLDGVTDIPTPLPAFGFRTATAFVQSVPMTPADIPITDDIDDHPSDVMLDSLVLGLQVGQPVAITGTQSDPAGVPAAEVALLLDIVHAGDYTTLLFQNTLVNTYTRATMSINANTVVATNGETVNEVLGSGNAATPNQTFNLKRPPLTYVTASNADGAQSTLSVQVNGMVWSEVPTLYGAGQADRSYVVRREDDGTTTVQTGDGIAGARLPTATQNVKGVYRTGIGLAGNVAANTITLLQTIPVGVRSVSNAVAASGAADPQSLVDARQNAPLTVLTLDRIVSIEDYQNFAQTFAGIGKAQAVALWSGRKHVAYLTIAAADGSTVAPTSQLYLSLTAALAAAGDPAQTFLVGSFLPTLLNVTVAVLPDPAFVAQHVLSAVGAALLSQFGWQRRAFGQPVSTAEIIAAVAAVPGVLASDVSQLYVSTDPPNSTSTEPPALLPSSGVTVGVNGIVPAELLYINQAGITVTEMSP
jgi:hypothetical protein